jgi:hypothetical protein
MGGLIEHLAIGHYKSLAETETSSGGGESSVTKHGAHPDDAWGTRPTIHLALS